MNKSKNKAEPHKTIAQNRRARHDYHIEQRFEAGLVLQGWEVKSLRAGKVQINDSYVHLKNGEAWLFNTLITPLNTVSTHFVPTPTRNRKLLLNQRELNQLFGAVNREGYTLIPLSLYWKNNRVKVEIALAKGKKLHDKRETEKRRDWEREKQRVLRRK